MIAKLRVARERPHHSAADEAVARADEERFRQGLPERISDPAVLSRIAEVLGLSELLGAGEGGAEAA